MSLVDDIISYWKFDESSGNAEDSVGSRDLTNVNSVSYVPAVINNGADLERGSSQYFSMSKALAGGAYQSIAQMTISLWVKFESVTTSVREPFFTSWSSNRGILFMKEDSNSMILILGNGSTVTFDSVAWTPSNGVWYHVAVTYNAGSIKFYLDGTQLGSTQSSTYTTIPTTTQNYFVGRRNDNGNMLDGVIDEMGVWDRALSDSEIAELYNGGDGLTYPFTPPPSVPVVDTLAVDDIAKYTATLNGEIMDIGSENADLRGFVYSSTSHSDPGDVAPADTDYEDYTSESGDFSEGVFDDGVTGLIADTTYYVRAWAHNDDGYSYGDEVTFDTLPIVYGISGAVTLGGTAIEGAVVRCVRQSDNVAITAQTTDAGGLYAFSDLDNEELYHLAVEYETESLKYNALSYWDIVPLEVD